MKRLALPTIVGMVLAAMLLMPSVVWGQQYQNFTDVSIDRIRNSDGLTEMFVILSRDDAAAIGLDRVVVAVNPALVSDLNLALSTVKGGRIILTLFTEVLIYPRYYELTGFDIGPPQPQK